MPEQCQFWIWIGSMCLCVCVCLFCILSKPLCQETVAFIKIQTCQNLRQEKRVYHVSSWKSLNPVEATRPVLHHGFSSGNQCTPEWSGNLDRWDGGMLPRWLVKIDVLIPPLTNMLASKFCCWVVDGLLFESTWSVRISWKLKYCELYNAVVVSCFVNVAFVDHECHVVDLSLVNVVRMDTWPEYYCK